MITRSRSKVELPSDAKSSSNSNLKRQRGPNSMQSTQPQRPNNNNNNASTRTTSHATTNNSTKSGQLLSSASRPRSVSHEQYTPPKPSSAGGTGRVASGSNRHHASVGLAPTNSSLRQTNQI